MNHYDLMYSNDTWKLKKQGAHRAIRNFENKHEGMLFSQDYVKKHTGSLKIHKMDGVIQEERTYPYSADPKRSPG